MLDNQDTSILSNRASSLQSMMAKPLKPTPEKPEEPEEVGCPAFACLRGVRDRSTMIEFRFRTGDVASFPYSWMGPVRFNPSVGILLKFTGDVVYLVLIRGSNLDVRMPDRPINLTDQGIFRHRVTWVREMDEDHIKRLPRGEPTIDKIEVVECDSSLEIKSWMTKYAPEFVWG